MTSRAGRRRSRGQAVVETAVCMPIMLALLIGIVDLGRYAQFDIRLASSARAGTQFGSQNATNAANVHGMLDAATLDDAGVAATAFSYYKCADHKPPTTDPTSGLTMAATGPKTGAKACPASEYELLYVVVSTTAGFRPIYAFFGKKVTVTRTAVMQASTAS